ncbi:MAG: hypothetical protein IIC64_16595 [SAR324 cluster bacterium]|nr:hypothetical protein [SAR324 cluster bacterium]
MVSRKPALIDTLLGAPHITTGRHHYPLLKVLMAGSTGLTLDLQLFGQRFQPHIAMIPIMGRYMMHPDDAAYAAKLLMTDNPNLKTVIPQHFRVKGAFPGMGTPAQFTMEVEKLGLPLRVLVPQVGQEIELRK